LRDIGFSRQKAGYARELALAMLDGLDLDALARLPDDDVRARLIEQQLVEAHRGTIRATSEPDGGSTVRFTVPA
jgi:hypothetical protein